MNYIEAKYLKHVGDLLNVKVSIKALQPEIVIFIRDFEFSSFKAALYFLQEDSRNVVFEEAC